ncbi:hypothetical protein AF72_06650 [Xylella taiwanensis]|uniref:Uncharacterized protein n=1 Tax=Xylella taiwanensis TaxID=1444770 RepID=Z9JJL9_9GAMM|nr:hypothetical protein AF72_06650 [Xylella taiwanensis]
MVVRWEIVPMLCVLVVMGEKDVHVFLETGREGVSGGAVC